MPKKYLSCVRKIMKSGKSKSSAHAICTSVNAGNVKQYRKRKKKK